MRRVDLEGVIERLILFNIICRRRYFVLCLMVLWYMDGYYKFVRYIIFIIYIFFFCFYI